MKPFAELLRLAGTFVKAKPEPKGRDKIKFNRRMKFYLRAKRTKERIARMVYGNQIPKVKP